MRELRVRIRISDFLAESEELATLGPYPFMARTSCSHSHEVCAFLVHPPLPGPAGVCVCVWSPEFQSP